MKIIIYLLVSFFLATVCVADSKTIRINLVYVDTPDNLLPIEFYIFSLDLRDYLRRQVNPRIRIIRSVRSVQQLPAPRSLSPDLETFSGLERVAKSNRYTHAIFAPTIVNGLPYVQGWGFTCSKYPKNISYSTAMLVNKTGVSRWYESQTAAAHEIVHQLGGRHRVGGLMDSAALSLGHNSIPKVDPKTLVDISRCQGR